MVLQMVSNWALQMVDSRVEKKVHELVELMVVY
jgi:hypothetical protein